MASDGRTTAPIVSTHPAQKLVAEGVPVLVVDALEVVEVEQDDRQHGAACARPG